MKKLLLLIALIIGSTLNAPAKEKMNFLVISVEADNNGLQDTTFATINRANDAATGRCELNSGILLIAE